MGKQITRADDIHLVVQRKANTLSWPVKKMMKGQHVELANTNTCEKQDSRCVTIDLRCFKWGQVSGFTGNIKCFWIVLLVQESFYGLDGFCTYNVCSCYDCFVILVIAWYYLSTQGAYLCKLCLYLFSHFLGFLLGVCDRSFLLLH